MACDCEPSSNGRINLVTVLAIISGITASVWLLYLWRSGIAYYAVTGQHPTTPE